MAKVITIKKGDLKGKIRVIGFLFFDDLGPIEMDILIELLNVNNGGPVNLSPAASESLRKALSLNDNTFSVSLSRLNKKRAIIKHKSLINFHPILISLINNNEFLILFEN